MANPFLNPVQLATGYLNGGGSTVLGKSVSPDSLPSTAYGGMLGKIVVVDDAEALKLSLTTTGTLRAGAYQLVQTKAGTSAAPIKGTACFWDTNANLGFDKRVVTPDISATIISNFAGIYVDVPAKGDYCWIQIAGLASLLCRSSAMTSNLIGDVVIFTGLTTNTFDGLADAGTIATAGLVKAVVGTWYEVPVINTVKLAFLKGGMATGYMIG